ncbi:MAG: dipeptidase [Lachnospiraceae bacterium]|nr:dipeptidase [Lachnospiraceae bacterium]
MPIPFIDMHCDTLMHAWEGRKDDIYDLSKTMLDVKRLQQGSAKAQFFAVFLQPVTGEVQVVQDDDSYIVELVKILKNTLKRHDDTIAFAGSYLEMQKNYSEGKISAFLTIEDGRFVDGRMEKFEEYYQLGIRLVTLTWNHMNCFGYPNSFDPSIREKGLFAFGKEALEEMNRLGILIDVSHLSDGGFWDVASISRKPFVASHSNSRSLCNHPRNLTDDMIQAIGSSGGVIGINQCPEFLRMNCHESSMSDLIEHIKHIYSKGGKDTVALGSDFDGISGKLALEGPQDYGYLAAALQKAGFTAEEVECIFYKNVERVLQNM